MSGNTSAVLPASPHTRGWTAVVEDWQARWGGFPAHAGMDPPRRRTALHPHGLPRTRGDGPRPAPAPDRGAGASPHTRGWTRTAGRGRPRRTGFPAHAGMDPSPCRPYRWMPRASPHTRGWTLVVDQVAGEAQGFPAHAGMDPCPPDPRPSPAGLPRTRGDGPEAASGAGIVWRASPHTRGWTPVVRRPQQPQQGFPAHAGMDPGRRRPRREGRGLPRTRGDGPYPASSFSRACQASPHTRGWTRTEAARGEKSYGFPAHAGMDPDAGVHALVGAGLPRTRGDGPGGGSAFSTPRPASPHTRGWTVVLPGLSAAGAGFPAHAGMDPAPLSGSGSPARLPRTRGDGS